MYAARFNTAGTAGGVPGAVQCRIFLGLSLDAQLELLLHECCQMRVGCAGHSRSWSLFAADVQPRQRGRSRVSINTCTAPRARALYAHVFRHDRSIAAPRRPCLMSRWGYLCSLFMLCLACTLPYIIYDLVCVLFGTAIPGLSHLSLLPSPSQTHTQNTTLYGLLTHHMSTSYHNTYYSGNTLHIAHIHSISRE